MEGIYGTVSINPDCTGTATIDVVVDGQVQRTAVLAIAFDSNMNHSGGYSNRWCCQIGTNVPVVITSDSSRVFPRE